MIPIYYFKDQVTETIVKILKKGELSGVDFLPLELKQIEDKGGKQNFPVLDEYAAMIWGDGSTHHVSYFFSPDQPYFKSTDDAHGDYQRFTEVGIHCANHNTLLVRDDENLQGMEINGVVIKMNEGIRQVSIPQLHFRRGIGTEYSGRVVHKSIDLDVIADYPANPIYREGAASFQEVRDDFEALLQTNEVVRFDVGGLGTLVARQKEFKSDNENGIREYRDLLKMYLDHVATR